LYSSQDISANKSKKNEIGEARSTKYRGEKCMQDLVRKTWRNRSIGRHRRRWEITLT